MHIAFIAPVPADRFLAQEQVKPHYRGREHAAPWVRLLAEALVRLPGTQVTVIADSRAVAETATATVQGVAYRFVPKREPIRTDPYHLFWPATWRMRKALRAVRPDVVLGFGAEAGNGLLAARSGYPNAVFLQGIVEKCLPFFPMPAAARVLWRALERDMVRRTGGVIAETAFARDWALGLRPGLPSALIPHAMDTFFLETVANPGPPLVAAVGSLIPLKGFDVVLRAFAACGMESARLEIAGDGPERPRLETLTTELGVASRVRFLGRIDRPAIRDLLARASLFALASRMDTAPNTITEAHAAGLPVIATRTGGIGDMVHEGVDGHLVAIDDHAAMASRMRALLADTERSRTMGLAARERVRRDNDPARAAAATRAFLDAIIQRHRGGSAP